MTIVLVHGAGHTAQVWDRVQPLLRSATVAVDLPGRGDHPGDLTRTTLVGAAAVAAADVRAASEGPWIVVAHSAAGIMAPHLVAALGDVEHLVLVAGMCAAEGGRAIDVVDPERRLPFEELAGPMRERYARHSYVADGEDEALLPEGLVALRDRRVVQMLDSIVTMYQTVSWEGVPFGVPRTWVRCLRDEIQPPDVQDRLIDAFGATAVRDLDTGHAPHREDPAAVAELFEGLAGVRRR
jgi:pimeloyl-ACP methyl ester carboxylesterase